MRCGACSIGSRPSSTRSAPRWEPVRRRCAAEYLTGLLSHLEHKTAEGIAYLLDQDRQPMQRFIGQADWDHRPSLAILAAQVGGRLGESDGVIVFDPSAFAKKGNKSVGVARQWCGRLGKVENCQVGVYMGYVSRIEHALVNVRLFLPEEWTKDRARCRAAGIPRGVRAQTRHELALEMLAESGSVLPHAWVAGDDEMGRPEWFRRALRDRGERVLAGGALEYADPRPGGRAAGVFREGSASQESVHTSGRLGRAARGGGLDEDRGPRRREGAVGGRGGEAPRAARTARRAGRVRTNCCSSHGNFKRIIPTSWTTTCRARRRRRRWPRLARVAKAEHRIEECLERAKGEAGLADYQVRNWPGWHRHQTLALLAAWFLTEETRRGKNPDPALTSPQLRQLIAGLIGAWLDVNELSKQCRRSTRWPAATSRRGSITIVHATSCRG